MFVLPFYQVNFDILDSTWVFLFIKWVTWEAQSSLQIHAVSPKSSLLAHSDTSLIMLLQQWYRTRYSNSCLKQPLRRSWGQMVAKWRSKVLQNVPLWTFCNTLELNDLWRSKVLQIIFLTKIDQHKAIIGLENQKLVFWE